jgi:hypothetical protein
MPIPKIRQPISADDERELSNLIVRWGMLVVGLLLVILSLVLKIEPALIPKGSNVAADILAKVGLVFICAWLAWPAVVAIKKAPGGMFVLFGIMAAMLLFVYRPRTLYITGPFIGVAAILAILMGWIRQLQR